MKKNILLFVSVAVVFFSLGFLTNHFLNRMLTNVNHDIESFNKMQEQIEAEEKDEEELMQMHESFKMQKLQEEKKPLPPKATI